MADSCSDYYDLGGGNLYAQAVEKAEAAGFPASGYENLCILYAGDFNDMFWGLWPHASGNHYYMSEVWGKDMGGGIIDYYFNHIGVHCHEFGHLLQLYDKYNYPGEPGNWDLMGAWGPYEGPDDNEIPGACSAHINAWSKWTLGWLEPTFVDTILPDQLFYPVENHSQAYLHKVRDKEYFMAEYRTKFSGTHFDYYAYPAPDPSTDGLLIWHMVRSGHSFYWETIERADNSYDNPKGDLWPGTTGKDAFTPLSSPNTGGYLPDVEEDSLLGRQPVATGFATEEIALHSEPLSITADFYINRWAGDIFRPTVWSGLQYVLGDVTVWVKPITIPEDTFNPEPKLADTDSALVVKPGTEVKFSNWTALEVYGALIAEGTADSMITFTSAAQNPEDGDWGEILFYKECADSFSLLKHCDISYGMEGIACLGSSPPISFCNIHHNRKGIICCDSSFSRIDTCSVYDNVHQGIWCCNGSVPVVHRCAIYGNGDYGLLNDDSTVTIVADSNWWGGDTTGPYDPSPGPPDYNPDGEGDKVSDYVIYRPWRKYGGVGVDEHQSEKALPDHFSLSQNYPNPFNPTTTISYQLPGVDRYHTTLKIYNILGQEVRALVDGEQAPGYYSVQWDGKDSSGGNLASGIYIYRIQAGDFVQVRRMVLLK
jgi:M6 family metalloprotease-like protein